ncbi:cysteine dioxygenase [Actinomadura livida]|uniref:Cysteine dioxygenase n=1 Tax=Actinomadura livida TaxID=79909 RepID=A0A7W7N0L2_9ACTN|nr:MULTISPECIES: cysteine dioxygenase [Actinomadura]MBB4778131.1 hypothetical protein [Actinomadura catellatispora]GGU29030.1 hypothetical protein GCM10010208_62210 [Actinomadura livida]
MVPDLTMRGQEDPHGRAITAHPPTVGQLAALVREVAGRPAEWWRLVGFDADRPVHVRLDDQVWLTTWPPGHGGPVRGRVSTLLAGELAEVVIAESGVTERPLRANRVRVHGTAADGESPNALTNPGPAFAVSLHAGGPGPERAAPGQLSDR